MGPRPLGQTKILRPGDFLFIEGKPLRDIHVIAEGCLRASANDPRDLNPKPISEETFGPNAVFGWNYMLWQDGDPPLVAPFTTVVPDSCLRCVVEMYTREQFLEHLQHHPERVFAYIAETPRALTRLFDPSRLANALSTSGEVSTPPPRPSQPGGTISLLQKVVGRLESQLRLYGHILEHSVLPPLKLHEQLPGVKKVVEILEKLTAGQVGSLRSASSSAPASEAPPDSAGHYRHISGVRPASCADGDSARDRPTPLEIPGTGSHRR